jgi:hypothetical protein
LNRAITFEPLKFTRKIFEAQLEKTMEKTRYYEFDWIRVLVFALLIPYHTGMIFVSWGWHIKSQETSELLEVLMLITNRWRLPLLFCISGIGSYYALKKITNWQFTKERFKRLFIPLFFGIFVIVPPQIYFERLQQGANFSYFEFYPSVFEFVSYPKGSFSWHHLWFISYLFVFSLISIPLFSYLKSEKGKKFANRLVEWIGKGYRFYLILIPALIMHLILDPLFPTTHNLTRDWANFTTSLYVFLLGYFFATNPIWVDKIRELRWISLFLAIICYVLLIFFWKSEILKPIFDQEARDVIYTIIDNGLGGGGVFAFIGFARQHLTYNSQFLQYANRAVYPFYILHQTVIVCIGYYLIQNTWSIGAQFLVINILTFLITWLLYEIVKRTMLTRVLFGIK